MKIKVILGSLLILAAIVFGSISFMESNIEYGDFKTAITSTKKIQVKGEWVREMESDFDANTGKFTFFMKDDNGEVLRVIFDGAKPNNFELATSVVAKGKYENDCFHASEILTKCPSKYEGDTEAVKKSL
jgi:cytochrome c-type biogenesis protein CcmE